MQEKSSFRPVDYILYDGPSAIVVFLVALPLCFGIALASGAPLLSGLIAGIIGGVVAGSLSKSSLSVSGPAAGLSTIVFSSIQELGSFPAFLLCVVIAGAIQIVLGFLKAGSIGHFFPAAVIKGMLAAIGLILILKQLPHAVGYDADYEGDENFLQQDGQNTFTELLNAFDFLSEGAIVVSILSLLIFYCWDKFRLKEYKVTSYLSAPLAVVVTGILTNMAFHRFIPELEIRSTHLVNLSGLGDGTHITELLIFPDFTGSWSMKILTISITIAIVASLETLLSIEAIDKLDPLKRITPLNHELKAQGVTNVISGFLGGLPVTAVIVRGSANLLAGARTKASTIIHGFLLLTAVLAIPNILRMIPLSSLAIILIMVGYKLTSPGLYRDAYQKGMTQFLPFIVTVAAILLTDILVGIFVGVLVSVFFVLKSNFRTAIILVNNKNQYLLKFTKDVSFLHKSVLRTALEKIPPGATLIVDGLKDNFLDADIQETLDDFEKGASAKRIALDIRKDP